MKKIFNILIDGPKRPQAQKRKGVMQMKNRKCVAGGILVIVLIFGLVLAGCDNGTTTHGGYPYPYEKSFPYLGQNLGVKMWDGNKTPLFKEVIQHLGRSTNAAWTASSPWAGDNSEVHLDAFINSPWGERTGDLWKPFIENFVLPNEGEQTYQYWPRVAMAPNLVKYWADKGLTKKSFNTVLDDGTNTNLNDDYYLYYPTGADQDVSKQYPLIILFHGGGEAAVQAETFGFGDIAIREKLFLLAAETPNAVDGALNDVVLENYPIDEKLIYAVGSSAGGSAARQYANYSLDPEYDRPEIAAVAIMDQPFSLYTLMYTGGTADAAIPLIKESGMPTVYLGGLADMYGMYNVHTSLYFVSHEGASPSSRYINPGWPDYVTGFNKLMEAHDITGKDFSSSQPAVTRFSVANSAANADGTFKNDETALEATYYTGYPYDTSTIVTSYGPKVYKSGFTGKDDLLNIVVENRPHMPCGYDAELIWTFISQWKRGDGGESVKR
jgi:hypothetical protein